MKDDALRNSLRLLRVPEPSEAAKGRALHRALIAFEQRDDQPEKPIYKNHSWIWSGAIAAVALFAVLLPVEPLRLLTHRGDTASLSLTVRRVYDKRLASDNKALLVEERMPMGSMPVRQQMEVAGTRLRDQSVSESTFQNRTALKGLSSIDGSVKEGLQPVEGDRSGGALGGAVSSKFVGNSDAIPVSTINGDQKSPAAASSISTIAGLSWANAPVSTANNTNVPVVASPVIKLAATAMPMADQAGKGEISARALTADPIGDLVTKLSSDANWGLWQNGLFKPIHLPSSALPEEVIAQLNKETDLYQGNKVTSYSIIESRPVKLGSPFTAVLLETNFGKRIILLQFQGSSTGWWSRAYDVPVLPGSPIALPSTPKSSP